MRLWLLVHVAWPLRDWWIVFLIAAVFMVLAFFDPMGLFGIPTP